MEIKIGYFAVFFDQIRGEGHEYERCCIKAVLDRWRAVCMCVHAGPPVPVCTFSLACSPDS